MHHFFSCCSSPWSSASLCLPRFNIYLPTLAQPRNQLPQHPPIIPAQVLVTKNEICFMTHHFGRKPVSILCIPLASLPSAFPRFHDFLQFLSSQFTLLQTPRTWFVVLPPQIPPPQIHLPCLDARTASHTPDHAHTHTRTCPVPPCECPHPTSICS